jgi:hypothetical protein
MQQAEDFRRRKEEAQRARAEEEQNRRQEAEALDREKEQQEAEERNRIQEFYQRLQQEADQRERRAEWRMRRNNPSVKSRRRALQQELALRRFDPSPEQMTADTAASSGGGRLAVANLQIAKDEMGNFVIRFQDVEGNELTDNLEDIVTTFDSELQNRLATCDNNFGQLPADLRTRICHALEFKMAARGATSWKKVPTSGEVSASRLPPSVLSRDEIRQLNTRSSLAELLNEGSSQEAVEEIAATQDNNGNNTDVDEADGWRRRGRAGSQVCRFIWT